MAFLALTIKTIINKNKEAQMRTTGINAILSIIGTMLLLCSLSFAQNIDLPITTTSDDARNLFKEARAYSENLHTARANTLLDEALKLDPNFAMAHIYKAYTAPGGFNVALKHVNFAVKQIDNVTGGEKNIILYTQATFNGDQVREKMFLDNLVVAFPYNKRIQNMVGTYYYGNSDYETAIKHYNKAVKLDENFAPVYNMIGYAESALENYDEAEKAFMKYIELIPTQPNPYDSFAELLMKRGKFDESIVQYQKAYDLDNTFISALNGIGDNYSFKGDFEKAREYYDKSFKEGVTINDKIASLYWTATAYLHEGNSEAAMKTLEKRKKLAEKEGLNALVINNTNLEGFILTELGETEKGMKKFSLANNLIEKANLPKDMKTNMTINSRLNMCYSLTANNKLEEAEKEALICEKMINERANPNEIRNLHSTLAILEMKKGNYKEAINHFEKTDLNNSAYNMQKMGIAYEKMGNTQMSNKFYNKAKALNQNGMGLALIRTIERD